MGPPVPGHLYSPVLCVWFLTWGAAVAGLRDVQARVPEAIRRGEHARLHCDYDLEGDALYSVKWYIGRREFYRFTPRERPQLKVFPIQGLSDLVVQRNCSNATQLCLHKVTLALSGRYSCEVSADSPSFKTAHVSGFMDVVDGQFLEIPGQSFRFWGMLGDFGRGPGACIPVVYTVNFNKYSLIPTHRPELRGMKARYRVGDQLTASCISRHSRPPANLTWSINGSPLKDKSFQDVRALHEPGTELLTALSSISVVLRREHFTDSGRLKVRCTASLYTLYWQITENSAELERPRAAVVAASNAVDTRTVWREDKQADKVTAEESSSNSAITTSLSHLVTVCLSLLLLTTFEPDR